jgi:hypothetical protein
MLSLPASWSQRRDPFNQFSDSPLDWQVRANSNSRGLARLQLCSAKKNGGAAIPGRDSGSGSATPAVIHFLRCPDCFTRFAKFRWFLHISKLTVRSFPAFEVASARGGELRCFNPRGFRSSAPNAAQRRDPTRPSDARAIFPNRPT